ncbi:protein BREAST CANCER SUSCEPTIBILITY 1 homolog [Magnolia sinica]|uniref:protein BREAST CANCER SUSCEPTIBILITY 1 homolog n=1 Tax=Magnolia sinica TaxID=86752 RepID=UPI00265889C6|nr:protein BREAST CANCER SUSCEPTIBILITY 1 homolog [Magnolia sinica]
MADSAHLEKMGRELKCPICLSLLNSAISLTCNHVFCNLCILKSMKSVSNCPVCKVPYRRREVRAAPHMDNLVSIYKSMEAASGINIFVTQAAPPTKKSEGQSQGEGGSSPCGAETDEPRPQKSKKRKALKELDKANVRISSSGPSAKPSFPAKKRVQVPLSPLSETPMRPDKVSSMGDQSTKHEVKRECGMSAGNGCKQGSSFVLKEKPAFNEMGEPMFKPFFWLREADEDEAMENLTPTQTDGDHLTYTPPRNAPTFSDIKDSDDESPITMTPTGEAGSKSKAADVFDSEMFEWTQRACSPELCSTPMKTQSADKHTLDGIQEKEHEAASQIETAVTNDEILTSDKVKSANLEQGNPNMDMQLPVLSSQKNGSGNAKHARKKSIKKGKRPSRKIKRKNVTTTTDRTDIVPDAILGELPTSCGKIPGDPNQKNENKCSENGKSLNTGREAGKSSKKGSSHSKRKRVSILMTQVNDAATGEALEEASIKSCEESGHDKGNIELYIELPVLSCRQTENDKAVDVGNKPERSDKKIIREFKRKHVRRSVNRIVNTTAVKVLKEVPINDLEGTKNRNHDNMEMGLPVLSCQEIENDKALDLGGKTVKSIKNIEAKVERNGVRKSTKVKRLKSCTSEVSKRVPLISNMDEEKENRIIIEQQENVEIGGGGITKTAKVLPIAKVHLLQKCKTISSHIQCAFCQSCDDSEASGKMLHYFNGKLVAADYNGGSNVIHSHRNCTEWAPNVFFEDDTAINLEAELARSRRIKCSCCGIKGASLGCYEKSCRKSFHVPCAKLTRECRWDTENFVMLCPLHLSLRLPNEISGNQRERKKRGSRAREIVHPGLKMNRPWKWPSGSPSKWVICCSALTVAEKEIISKFVKLAGVSLSKTWNSTVTHIIASTDENGACRRTIKFFMGILEGKWILRIDWIKACMMAMEPVPEEQYEIHVDVHGVQDGPKRGRQRVMNKEPKLFNAFKFYFAGEFVPSYKGYLQDLVVAGGGTVLQRKPISRDQERLLNESPTSTTFIIYSLEHLENGDSSKNAMVFSCRRAEAQTLANVMGAKVAGHSWILDSIAACRLQSLDS